MKLSARDSSKFFSSPETERAGLLIFGPDSMRVALKRQDFLAALLGPSADEEMRLTRLSASEVRKDGALLLDAIKAQGFFPGPRAVFVTDGADNLTKIIEPVLHDWTSGDAMIVVTAGQLTARSSIRKLFEAHNNSYAAGIYANLPTREEIESTLTKAGLNDVGSEAMSDLTVLAKELDPGDFQQTMEKLALYKFRDSAPVDSHDVAACAPTTTEAALDDALNLVAEARVGDVGPIMHKLEGQGLNPTTICIAATRHFRALHLAASHPKGPESGLNAARPPVFGPRRDRMVRQARNLGMHKLENVLCILTDTDLGLRSTRPVPARAMLERAFIRIAMLAKT